MAAWFAQSARVYPWSLTTDPYAIWISEIMLQQTVVTAVVAPFERWMERWPTLTDLAQAEEAAVLRAWEGLGYASRARNLHRSAQLLVRQGRTQLPSTEAELLGLPGIGAYTAAAIVSFAFGRSALPLDANLKRILQRLEAQPEWTVPGERRWREHWRQTVTDATSRSVNQGLMQLGQQVCLARRPRCALCPLALECQSFQQGRQEQIPAPRTRSLHLKTTTVGVWHRLGPTGTPELWLAQPRTGRFATMGLFPPWPGAIPPDGQLLSPRLHTYTKYRDQLTVWLLAWTGPEASPPLPADWWGRWVSAAELAQVGMLSVYRQIANEAWQTLAPAKAQPWTDSAQNSQTESPAGRSP